MTACDSANCPFVTPALVFPRICQAIFGVFSCLRHDRRTGTRLYSRMPRYAKSVGCGRKDAGEDTIYSSSPLIYYAERRFGDDSVIDRLAE